MKLSYKKSDILRGALIYTTGDTIASLLLNEFSIIRLLGMALIGATIYAFEIPNYFAWIDRKVSTNNDSISSLKRTGLALLYFNPVWIARHLLFINIFKRNFSQIGFGLLSIGLYSFLVNIPVSLIMNYLIQNKIPLKWRFAASATFSALMAIYYAAGEVLFK